MTSAELFERAKKVAPGGVHSPVRSFKGLDRPPIFFKAAEGAYLESVEGQRYIDFCQSFGPNLLGHRDPDVSAAISEMQSKAWSFGACEPYSLELAEWMIQRLPFIEKLRFVNSGTEAVMSALRVVRAATGRRYILKFEGCYHGHVDSMLVKAGSGLAGVAASTSAGVSEQVAAETLVAPLDREDLLEELFAEKGDQIAAVVIEPLPANFGLLIQRKEFLQKIQTLCEKHGAKLIFDEVISGFRVAMGGMAQVLDMNPDLVCYGKIIGGGFPVGCYAGRAELMDLVAPSGPVYQAGTLSASPFGMAAGLATLKKIESHSVHEALNQRTEAFAKQLRSLFEAKGVGLDVAQFASLFWIHPKTDKPLRSTADFPAGLGEAFKTLFNGCVDRGVYLAPNGYEVSFMSLAHDQAVLDKTLEVFDQVLKGV